MYGARRALPEGKPTVKKPPISPDKPKNRLSHLKFDNGNRSYTFNPRNNNAAQGTNDVSQEATPYTRDPNIPRRPGTVFVCTPNPLYPQKIFYPFIVKKYCYPYNQGNYPYRPPGPMNYPPSMSIPQPINNPPQISTQGPQTNIPQQFNYPPPSAQQMEFRPNYQPMNYQITNYQTMRHHHYMYHQQLNFHLTNSYQPMNYGNNVPPRNFQVNFENPIPYPGNFTNPANLAHPWNFTNPANPASPWNFSNPANLAHPWNFTNPGNFEGNTGHLASPAGNFVSGFYREDTRQPGGLIPTAPPFAIASQDGGRIPWYNQMDGGRQVIPVPIGVPPPTAGVLRPSTLSPHGVEFLSYQAENTPDLGPIEPSASGSSEDLPDSREEDNDADRSASVTEASSPADVASSFSAEIVSISTASVLNVEDSAVYELLLLFVPPVEDLKHLGFPVACPPDPTFAIVYNKSYERSYRRLVQSCHFELFMKICVRCGVPFDSRYPNDIDSCYYHWGKQAFNQNYKGFMTCCSCSPEALGCNFCYYHVWDGLPNAEEALLDGFVTPELMWTQGKKVYGLDCETCYTKAGTELVRVALVSITGQKLYDTLVHPKAEIIDFNTRFSGISKPDYTNSHAKHLPTVQQDLLRIIEKDSIIVGHGLENDLRALRMIHPLIVDTSIIFPHEHGFPYRRSLKSIAQEVLQKEIQGAYGHNPIEDARVCVQLALSKVMTNFNVTINFNETGKKRQGKKKNIWKSLNLKKSK